MTRFEIIEIIGKNFLASNIENGEWSYAQAFSKASKDFEAVKHVNDKGRSFQNLDLRFINDQDKFVVLVETKQNYDRDLKGAKEQLAAYVDYENTLTGYTVIAILANTADDRILVYSKEISDAAFLPKEIKLKSFGEYLELAKPAFSNNREEVMRNTYALNELLHTKGINERLRGQFVGTCLLAIKNGLTFEGVKTNQIIAGIRDILESLLIKNLNKSQKLVIIDKKILDDQDIKELKSDDFVNILNYIKTKIYPFINDKSTQGQDLLNLFFTTFNKYVGKADKNQAFTPDHIVDFMCRVIGINRNNRVLDPCCGSGSFLVRALTMALDDCDRDNEKEEVKREHIYGIEADDTAFGLSTTNMLIHGDGNSNVYQDSCFNRYADIENWHLILHKVPVE